MKREFDTTQLDMIVGNPPYQRVEVPSPPVKVQPWTNAELDANFELDELLAARRLTHGDFILTSTFTQQTKAALRSAPGWSHMTPAQQEALDMIIHKIARIGFGDPLHRDAWVDLAGYATRALEGMV